MDGGDLFDFFFWMKVSKEIKKVEREYNKHESNVSEEKMIRKEIKKETLSTREKRKQNEKYILILVITLIAYALFLLDAYFTSLR